MAEEKVIPEVSPRLANTQVVESSNVHSFVYEKKTQTLEVVFKGGTCYRYYGVPEVVYLHLLRAPSKGKLFNETVKRAGYRFERWDRPVVNPGS